MEPCSLESLEPTDFTNEPTLTIDVVNDAYFLFKDEDASNLRNKYRMIFESTTSSHSEDSLPSPPFKLLDEQVFVLLQYGCAVVRRLKDDNSFEPEIFRPPELKKQTSEEEYEKARRIAIGRKAKESKRKLISSGNAKTFKVRAKDMDGIEVTREEVEDALNVLQSSTVVDERITLSYCPESMDNYETLDLFSLPVPSTSEFRLKRLVFHDLWRRGFYITAGLRFGCDYLAYEGLPGEVHAKYLVKCLPSDEDLSPLELISLTRVATQVKKAVLLAIVADDNHTPHYMTLQWWKAF
ncbi:unnamed protein product [Auanema sp. JU1783]|nr:unnamed protein product [Auanema sp. JU1783]